MNTSSAGGVPVMPNSSRRQPTRSVRTTTSRPSNYYARHFGSTSGAAENESAVNVTPGFCPAITHFTDSISALPREVMRHFTLLKETEGKAYQPDRAMRELVDTINSLPNPPKEYCQRDTQAFLGMSLNASLNGSIRGSVVDGQTSGLLRAPANLTDQPPPIPLGTEQADTRRRLFFELQVKLREMTMVLDEKNMILCNANETLARQLARLDGTMPYVENELSEDARLGSNTHWALPHMRELRRANGGNTNERTRRDVQAANGLAAATTAVNESDLAATRSEARREAMLAKRKVNHVDSDFEDRPVSKRAPTTSKSRKPQDLPPVMEAKIVNGSSGGPAHKRRRTEKEKAPALERSLVTALNGKLASARGGSPKETHDPEGQRRKAKPLPTQAVARKKYVEAILAKKLSTNTDTRIAAPSPSLASSPTRGTSATTANRQQSPTMSTSRPSHGRARQNSNQSIIQDTLRNHPSSAAPSSRLANGETSSTPEVKSVANVTRRALVEHHSTSAEYEKTEVEQIVEEADPQAAIPAEKTDTLPATAYVSSVKQENTQPVQSVHDPKSVVIKDIQGTVANSIPQPPHPTTRARNDSRASKPQTPVATSFPEPSPATTVPPTAPIAPPLLRSRSVRSNQTISTAVPVSSPPPAVPLPSPRRSHKKGGTAAVTRKDSISAPPKLPPGTTGAPVFDPLDEFFRQPRARARPGPNPSPPKLPLGTAGDPLWEPLEEFFRQPRARARPGARDVDDAPSEDAERYCVCNDVSYGEMVACDGLACEREWFHLHCVGLSQAPKGRTKWFCEECKERMKRAGKNGVIGGVGGGVSVGGGSR